MENNTHKIFTNRVISTATFFGGPIVAGFMIAKNYKAFGNSDAARNSIFIGIISTLLLFAGMFTIPEQIIDKIPQALFPTIYTTIVVFLVEKFQGNKINDFLADDGKKASNWLAFGYSLTGLAVISVLFVILFYATPSEGYENRIKIDTEIILYSSEDINEDYCQELAQVIKQSGFLEGAEAADIMLNDEGDSYKLLFILPDTSLLKDEQFLTEFNRFENYINNATLQVKRIEIGFTHLLNEILLWKKNTFSYRSNDILLGKLLDCTAY